MADDGKVFISKAGGKLVGLQVDCIFVEITLDLLVLFASHFYHLGFVLAIHKIKNSLLPFLDTPQKLLLFGSLSLKM